MGNGQHHRNRRGARPRAVPHKHGGAGNSGRATTHLIPPVVAPATVVSDNAIVDAIVESAGEDVSEWAAESALSTTSSAAADNLVMTADDTAGQDTSSPSSTPVEAYPRRRDDGGHASSPSLVEDAPSGEGEEAERTPKSVNPSGRGRFERFYAPGQGARGERVERVERVAPPITHTLPAVSAAPAPSPLSRRVERTERTERAPAVSGPLDEDEGPEYTGPRGDVRGPVGDLIDALHEVFARDRTIASQGGVARCGVCYLHFPTGELTYRDAEGFYVCESCARALGSARVPMVRRQQRQ